MTEKNSIRTPDIITEAIKDLERAQVSASISTFAHYGSALLAIAITVGWLTLSTHSTPFSPILFAFGVVSLLLHNFIGVMTLTKLERIRLQFHASTNQFIAALFMPCIYLLPWGWLTFERLSGMNDRICNDPRSPFLEDMQALSVSIVFNEQLTDELRMSDPTPVAQRVAQDILQAYGDEQRNKLAELKKSLANSLSRYPLGMHPAQLQGRKIPSFAPGDDDPVETVISRLRAAQELGILPR